MRIPLSYSIWLMPEGNTKNKLTTLIEKLRLEYGGPNFEPHVTLIGGFVKEEKVLLEKTEQLASRLSQFTVSIKGASFHDEFFRSFFLNVEQTPEFLKARRIACDIFDFEETDYIPHMSLFLWRCRQRYKTVNDQEIRIEKFIFNLFRSIIISSKE